MHLRYTPNDSIVTARFTSSFGSVILRFEPIIRSLSFSGDNLTS